MQFGNLSPQAVMPREENRPSVILNQDSCPDHDEGLKKFSVISLKVPACLIFSYSERCEVSYGSQEELTAQLTILVGPGCNPAQEECNLARKTK